MSYHRFFCLGLALLLTLGIAKTRLAAAEDSASAAKPPQSQAQAPSQANSRTQLSLGEIARKARAEQVQNPAAPAKVYTNADLPPGPGGVTVVAPSAAATSTSSAAKHGPAYYASRMAELQQNLAIHQRELAVLQQKLGQNMVQFYPNPNAELQQQYSRGDIDKVTAAIDQKKQQVEADQKAIADLQQEVQAAGGSSDWLAGGSATPKAGLNGVEKGSREYWQQRFEAARKTVEQADRETNLSQDELDLLKAQQAHEMVTAAATDAAQQVAAKQTQVDSDRATAEKAHQELDALQKEFEASGAPADWNQPEQPQ